MILVSARVQFCCGRCYPVPQPLERHAGHVDKGNLVCQGVCLRVLAEATRGEQGVDVLIPSAGPQAFSMDEVLVDVMDHAMSVAYNCEIAPFVMKLSLDEHTDWQRKRRSDRELAMHVDLMGCASALD